MTGASDAATGSLDGVFAAASRNASRGGDVAIATGSVIAKRIALGVGAVFDPWRADHSEFRRMLPEKLQAFSAAGVIMLDGSGEASRQITRLASDEICATARAALAMADCINPAALMQAQGDFVVAWFDRLAANVVAMGMLALGAQDAALAPIRLAVVANAERLG